MIDASKVHLGGQIYSDVAGKSQVYEGTYAPIDPSGAPKTYRVAVKSLPIPVDQLSFLTGLIQELAIQMKLEDCPHVCKCYGYYADGKRVYIVMELLEKDLLRDMRDLAQAGMKYREETLLEYLRQVAFALQYAKRKSIAHRDVKPENILMDREGRLKLVDFGSGAISDGKAVKLSGTPLYMSPEQLPNLQLFQETGSLPSVGFNPFQSDVYSLGLSFLHLALGKPPVDLLADQSRREVAVQQYMSSLVDEYPVLHRILQCLLVRDPANRCTFSWVVARLNELLPGGENYPTMLEPGQDFSPPVPDALEHVPPQPLSYPSFYSTKPDWFSYVQSIVDQNIPYEAAVMWSCFVCKRQMYITGEEPVEVTVGDGPHLCCKNCVIQA